MVGWARQVLVAAGALSLVATACGSDGAPVGSGAGSSTPATSDIGAAADPVDLSLVPWCAEVPAPGPIADGEVSTGEPEPTLMGVLNRYGAEHPDTFGGLWVDRVHGGTVVLAFTDDPDPHREAIAGLTARPGDPTGVVTVPPTDADGSVGTPVAPAPPSTTVAESGHVVDVVRVEHSAAELATVQAQVNVVFDDGAIPLGGNGITSSLNRVTMNVNAEPTDEMRRTIAERVPVDAVCLSGGPPVEPYFEHPTTMIPAEGSDPWITCSRGLMPLRRSALEDPPAIADDDPLQVAFEDQIGRLGPSSGSPDDWYLLVQGGDDALYATGRPAAGFVEMRREQGRWTAVGGGLGGACESRPLLPEGLAEVSWAIDPSFPPPVPTDTVLHLLVKRVDCSSGTPVADDLVGPEVVERGDQLVLAFAAEPLPPGYYNCIGTMGEPVTVTLPVPLGDRTLMDGTYLPPRPVPIGDGLLGG